MSKKRVKIPPENFQNNSSQATTNNVVVSFGTATNSGIYFYGFNSNASTRNNALSFQTGTNSNTDPCGSGSNVSTGNDIFSSKKTTITDNSKNFQKEYIVSRTTTNDNIDPCGSGSNASTGNNADLLSNTTQTVNLCTSSNQIITFFLQFFALVQKLINEQRKLRQQILQQVIAQEIRSLSQQFNEQQQKRPRSIHICDLCKKEVHSSKLPCHVRMAHLKIPIYFCTKCNKSSNYSKNNIKTHMTRIHKIVDPQPIDYAHLHALKVRSLMKKCFPKVKSRSALNNFGYFPIIDMAESDDSD
ncbi:unnamed protein product [Brugia timori]|uniref:C2H2-type domain-containing protein n=1 Tax=Brugia timori TaxID=42155 RepID=A0A0R3R1W8_9BILA|nr:unnamed protein product [Brugia timori]